LEYLWPVNTAADPRDVSIAHLMYALHAVAIAVGVATTVLGHRTFLFGICAIAAILMNFVRRARVRGSWLQAHFDWQLHTFGWALAGLVAASLAFGPIVLILTRVPLLEISFVLLGAWAAVRAARGWMALREARPVVRQGIF
jgi:uncharacterized membrane protein